MKRCDTCNSDCFPTVDLGCTHYIGEAFASLGIKDGMSGREVIQKLAEGYIALSDKINKCKLCDSDTNVESTSSLIDLEGLGTYSTTCSSAITNTNFQYSVTGGATFISVSYSMQNVIDNLPTNYTVLSKSCRIFQSGIGTTLYSDTNLSNGVFNIEPNRFPINMVFNILVQTPCGTVSIDKTIIVSDITNGSYTLAGKVTDNGTDDLGKQVTQEGFNTIVKQKLAGIDRDLSTLKNPNISGTSKVKLPSSDIDTALQTLINLVDGTI